MRPSLLSRILCVALVAAAGCTTHEIVDLPERENSIVISGKEYTAERLLWGPIEIIYPPDEAAEQGVSVRIMAAGAIISADVPLRLVGSRIDLASRNRQPRPGAGTYFSFHVSVRGEEARLYRIVSWGTDDELDTGFIPYGGSMTVSRGDSDDEWIVEWELVDNAGGAVVSTGFVKNIFEKLNS